LGVMEIRKNESAPQKTRLGKNKKKGRKEKTKEAKITDEPGEKAGKLPDLRKPKKMGGVRKIRKEKTRGGRVDQKGRKKKQTWGQNEAQRVRSK